MMRNLQIRRLEGMEGLRAMVNVIQENVVPSRQDWPFEVLVHPSARSETSGRVNHSTAIYGGFIEYRTGMIGIKKSPTYISDDPDDFLPLFPGDIVEVFDGPHPFYDTTRYRLIEDVDG